MTRRPDGPLLLCALTAIIGSGCASGRAVDEQPSITIQPRVQPGAQPGVPSRIVKPTFDWPVGLTSDVTVEVRRSSSTPGERKDGKHTLRYQMEVQQAKNGRIIEFANVRVNPPTGNPISVALDIGALMAPSYRVTNEGKFIGLADRAGVAARLESLVGDRANLDSIIPAEATLFRNLLSDRALIAHVQREWTELVEMWVGDDLELGVSYLFEGEVPSPVVDGTIWTVWEIIARDRVPCTPEEEQALCVEFQSWSWPDRDILTAMMWESLGAMVADSVAAETTMEVLEHEIHIILVARVESMIPYRLKVVERHGNLVTNPEGRWETRLVNTRLHTFRHRESSMSELPGDPRPE